MPFDDLTLLDDDALLLLYAAGDPAAARILTERLAPRVHAHAWRLLGGVVYLPGGFWAAIPN